MKKISATKWSKLLEKKTDFPTEIKVITGSSGEQGLEIEIKKNISMQDRMSFAKNVCEACFDETDGSYIPYARDVSFGIYLVNYFTNLDIGKDMEKATRLIEETDIVSAIKDVIGNLSIDLSKEVDELLVYERRRRLKSTKAEDLFDALTVLVDKFAQVADDAKENLSNGNIQELTKVMNAYNNDQESLVKSILNAEKIKNK